MIDSNNFPDTQKTYFESRKISIGSVACLIDSWSLKLKEESFHLAMKDHSGNIVGWQERVFTPLEYTGKELLSKSIAGSKSGLFFQDIDCIKPVLIVEWELNYLAVMHIGNVVWISNLDQLRGLVEGLKRKRVTEIMFLLDNDCQSEVALNKLLNMDDCFDIMYDCKELIWPHKDIVSYLVAGNEITIDSLRENRNSFEDIQQFSKMFTLDKGKINHNEFAKHIARKFNIVSTQENLFIYDHGDKKGIWQTLDRQYVEKLILKQLEVFLSYAVTHFRTHDLSDTMKFLVANANTEEIKYWLLTQNEREINLSDGILEIKTMAIRPYTKEDYKFQKLPYSKDVFPAYSEPKKFLHFLDEILEWAKQKEEVKAFLQEFIGWLFVSSTRLEKALLLWWGWSNGKGVLLSVIKNVLWTENCSSIGLHEINEDQYLYNLIGKLANIDSDMQQNVQLDSWIIKKLVSGEAVSAKKMYRNPIEFVPYCRILIATNELPYLKTIDNSIRRRFVFLNLKQSFYGKEDPDLINKILSEKDNIFVWAIEWLKRLLERGNFIVPKELDEELENFIKENDTIELFFDDGSVVKDKKGKIYNKELYLWYKMFCNECWYKTLSQRNFNKRLRDKGFEDFKDGLGRGFLGLS